MRTRAFALGGAVALAATLAVATPAYADPGVVASVAFAPDIVVGGEPTTGTVGLTAPATEETRITLQNYAPVHMSVPAGVTVPAGATSVDFPVVTRPITTGAAHACVRATAPGGSEAVGCVFVQVVGGPQLIGLRFTPPLVAGGSGTSTGRVYLGSPTAGTTLSLTSANPAAAGVPAQVTVPALATIAAFPVTTGVVGTATPVVITATAGNGSTTSTTLNVTPQPGAPGSDTVRVTRAEWDRGRLRIEATSTNPNAVLTVFFASAPDEPSFNLTNNGGGRYSTERQWLDNPLPIIVRSTYGGTATGGRR